MNFLGSLNVSECKPTDEKSRPNPFSTDGSSSSKQITKAFDVSTANDTTVNCRAASIRPWSYMFPQAGLLSAPAAQARHRGDNELLNPSRRTRAVAPVPPRPDSARRERQR